MGAVQRLGCVFALPFWLTASMADTVAPRPRGAHLRKAHAQAGARPAAKTEPAQLPLLPMPASTHPMPAETPVTTSGHSVQFGTVTVTPGGFVGLDGVGRH